MRPRSSASSASCTAQDLNDANDLPCALGPAALGNVGPVSTPQTVELTGADGITLVADEWNGTDIPADHPTILLLHGGGQNRFSWKNTGQVLADRGFHVIAVDTRGHGDSDRSPDADYALETLTDD